MNTSPAVRSGMSFLDVLTIVFVVLKLTNYIDWSWWWVLSPIWIPLALIVLVVVLASLSGD